MADDVRCAARSVYGIPFIDTLAVKPWRVTSTLRRTKLPDALLPLHAKLPSTLKSEPLESCVPENVHEPLREVVMLMANEAPLRVTFMLTSSREPVGSVR